MAAMTALAIGGAIAVGGIVGGHLSGEKGAEAQAKIAQAQEAEARATRAAAQAAAEPSAGELSAMRRQIEVADQQIARQSKVLESYDPAVIEAGNQALKLLRGEEAATLDPLRKQRERQRQQLQSRLHEQLGPGFATSSAGIEAMNRFDEDTSGMLAGAQERSLGQVFGMASTGVQVGAQSAGTLGQLGGLGLSAEQNIANRRLSAITGTPTTQYAGSQFAGDLASSQNLQKTFGGISQLGGSIAGAGLGNMGGGGAPAAASPWKQTTVPPMAGQ